MLDIQKVSYAFDDHVVLDDITLSLDAEVVALVGPNGAGKTTLFRVLLGELSPDQGSVARHNEIIGFLPHVPQFHGEAVEEFLSHQRHRHLETFEIERVLREFGFEHLHLDQQADNLSGGEKTKLSLAGLRLAEPQPTVLLLDEPTNNLDLNGIEWLERFVTEFPGAVLVTSHDRAFLDKVADRVIELTNGKLTSYGGNYTFYRDQKARLHTAQARRYEENVQEVRRLEQLIATKKERARQVSKEKYMRDNDKYAKYFFAQKSARIDRDAKSLESRLERMEKLEKPPERRQYPFAFSGEVPAGKTLLSLKDVTFVYEDRVILDQQTFSIQAGERVWISGQNGAGKSTLLSLMAGFQKPQSGVVEQGVNVHIGFFSQELMPLTGTHSLLQELQSHGATATEAFKYGTFLHFSEEEMRQQGGLSRGQRTKLEFMKLLMQNVQMLILDEPTNHLEIDTREQIEEALREYKGAIVVASHDRAFIHNIGVNREIMV